MEDFKTFFEQNYKGTKAFVAKIITPIFGNLLEAADEDILKSYPNLKPAAERANILSIHRFGECRLDVPMDFFDITLKNSVQLSQSRVYIQQLLRQIMQTYSAALIIFHYTDNQGDWRVSYISKGSNATDATSAKRYTYLMGENQKCRTAADRFATLMNKEKTEANITEAFSVEALTRDFYKELFAWYQLALSYDQGFAVTYPNDTSTEADDRKIDEHLIRLITRLMFVWFIKQKKLVPEKIFKINELQHIITNFDPLSKNSGNYYNAILQNLFFATLNRPISEREFANLGSFQEQREHYGIKTLFRDAKEGSWFKLTKEEIINLFNGVPFLNGGLFECLDKENADGKIMYYDGFSRKAGTQNRAFLPNCLFFDPKIGIIPLLEKYNFTVEENTPTDVEVALDPELLGKVFENLLGAFNPETKETARKQSGSFYTPREIVNYMVDESLIAYLKNACANIAEDTIRQLFTEDTLPVELIQSPQNCQQLIAALKAIKTLDPACGSGAFPMGILNRMLDLLQKLLPSQLSNYETKLHLIENCIYGIDIQTIAVQITKLRFFISLICEQNPTDNPTDNYGIIALPNLETKFVAANTLIGLAKKPSQGNLFEDPEVEITKNELKEIRHRHFSATNAHQKKEYRKKDAVLREKLAKLLEENTDYSSEDALQLSAWNPYDQNSSSKFFNAEWMFGVKEGFDLVVGNPPYIDSEAMTNLGLENERKYIVENFEFINGNWDIYMAFFEKGLKLSNGILCFITPDKWLSKPFGLKFREKCLVSRLTKILHAGNGVFESATVDAIITLFEKKSKDIIIEKYNKKKEIELMNIYPKDKIIEPYLIDFLFSAQSSFIKLVDESDSKIKNIAECENACATSDAYKLSDLIKDIEIPNEDLYYRLINTGTINKYFGRWGEKQITYLGTKVYHPAINKIDFESIFGQSYIRRAKSKKIVFKGLNLLDACLDLKGNIIPGKSTLVICNNDDNVLKFLCALINSRLTFIYIKIKYSSSSYCGGISFTKDMINNFPLPNKLLQKQNNIVIIVNKIIEAKNTQKTNEIADFERQIDELVFKLYNLSYEEVLVVCPDFWLSAEDYEKLDC